MVVDQYDPSNNNDNVNPIRDKFTIDISDSTSTPKQLTTTEISYTGIDFYLFRNSNLIDNTHYSTTDTSSATVITIDSTTTMDVGDVFVADYFKQV